MIIELTTDLADRLRTLREAQEVSQEELARRIGLGRTSITNIEAGRQPLSVARLVSIGQALGVEVQIVLEPVKEEPR